MGLPPEEEEKSGEADKGAGGKIGISWCEVMFLEELKSNFQTRSGSVGHNLDEVLGSINYALGDADCWNRGKKGQMVTDRNRAEPQHSDEREYCILCGRLTETVKDRSLSEREYYIEGAGQLCRECYQEIYVPRNNENVIRLDG